MHAWKQLKIRNKSHGTHMLDTQHATAMHTCMGIRHSHTRHVAVACVAWSGTGELAYVSLLRISVAAATLPYSPYAYIPRSNVSFSPIESNVGTFLMASLDSKMSSSPDMCGCVHGMGCCVMHATTQHATVPGICDMCHMLMHAPNMHITYHL